MVATHPLGVGFFQWANQTQNALLNHYNRSGDAGVSNTALAQSYGGAVGTALTISYTSAFLINRVKTSRCKPRLRRLVPFASVSTANMLNTFLMRRHELVDGAIVRDAATGKELGRSAKASERAIRLTALSRAAMSFLMLGIPPFIFAAYDIRLATSGPTPVCRFSLASSPCSFSPSCPSLSRSLIPSFIARAAISSPRLSPLLAGKDVGGV
jgi:hypothetical protein